MTYRLNHDANDLVDIVQYYKTRALQLASLGFKWSKTVEPTEHGYLTFFTKDEEKFCSGYLPLVDEALK
jgi:hypothetical protein